MIDDRRDSASLTRRSKWVPWILWGLSLLVLLTALGRPPVMRTQESRVLETARQMLPRAWPDWLVPRLNNTLRLQKPPISYWMTATSYALFGVSETAGRLPNALTGWATLAMVFLIGRRLFDPAVGVLAAGLLLGSELFFRNSRLAETDAPSSLMVIIAIYALLRAANGSAVWLHVAAAAVAGAALSKGGPAAYPLLFLLGYAAMERDWRLPLRFVTSGAVFSAVVLATPWFLYVIHLKGVHVFSTELDNLANGRTHFDWPWVYLPAGLVATGPWSPLVVVGVIGAIRRWQVDHACRLVLIWASAVAVPLCFLGNKQPHYLLPMMPPLMLLAARALGDLHRQSLNRCLDAALGLTMTAGLAAIPAIFIIARGQRGRPIAVDWATATGVLLVIILVVATRLRRDLLAAYRMGIVTIALLMPLIIGIWAGGVVHYTPRRVAAELRQQFGDGPYVFFGPNFSLPLCFTLREEIDTFVTTDDLLAHSRTGTIVISMTKPNAAPPALLLRFELVDSIHGGDQTINCFRDSGP